MNTPNDHPPWPYRPGPEGDEEGENETTTSRELTGELAEVVKLATVLADKLGDLDPALLDGVELGETLVGLHTQQQRITAGTAKVAHGFKQSRAYRENGHKSVPVWMTWRCRENPRTVRALFGLGASLADRPVLDEALTGGEVNTAHVRVLAFLAGHKRYAAAYHEAEDYLLDCARSLEWTPFCQAMDYWKNGADPDGAEDDAASDHEARKVELYDGLRGTGLLEGELTSTCRETFANALDRMSQELFEADWADAEERLGRKPELHELARTKAQRNHDALEEMAIRASTADKDAKRPRPLLSILVGLDRLTHILELDSGLVVTPGQVQPYLDHADIERIVYDGPSRVLDIGETRTFRGALRRAIQARDRTCQHPGCDVPANRCQVDHVQPWSHNGATIETNGQLLCGFHNRQKADRPPDTDVA